MTAADTVRASDFGICDTHENRLSGKQSCVVCEWLADTHSRAIDELKQEKRCLVRNLLVMRLLLIGAFVGMAVLMVVKR